MNCGRDSLKDRLLSSIDAVHWMQLPVVTLRRAAGQRMAHDCSEVIRDDLCSDTVYINYNRNISRGDNNNGKREREKEKTTMTDE